MLPFTEIKVQKFKIINDNAKEPLNSDSELISALYTSITEVRIPRRNGA